MRRFVLLDENGAILGEPTSDGKNRHATVIVSPLETHTYLTGLPPLRKDRIAGALRFKLRALHPGNPDSARIDFHPNADAKNAFIAFVTENTVMERYTKTGLPAVAPVSILSALAGKKSEKTIGIFWTTKWIEVVLFDGAKVMSIEAAAVGSGLRETFARLLESFPGGFPIASIPIKNVYLPSCSPEPALIRETLSSAGAATISMYDLSISPIKTPRYDYRLFSSAPARDTLFKKIITALFIANLILAAWSIHRVADLREQENAKVKRAYDNQKRRYATIEKNVKELDELEKRYATLISKRPISLYHVISEASRCVGSGAWIKNISIRKNAFSLEAEGSDALKAFTRFEESASFENVKLHQATPSPKRGESFSISGMIRDDK